MRTLKWKFCNTFNNYSAIIIMRLNKYLFNRVNNKERERGQRSVVWLKRGQPCLHHLHVLSTVFLWWPFSSFSLWIILLPYQLSKNTSVKIWSNKFQMVMINYSQLCAMCKPSKSEILRLYSFVHVAMEIKKTSNSTCQPKSFISISLTCLYRTNPSLRVFIIKEF